MSYMIIVINLRNIIQNSENVSNLKHEQEYSDTLT
jgi:hypothetical protein